MNVKLVIQKDGVNTLREEFLNKSNKELKRMYILSGTMKETGFDVIDECLIDNKARKLILLGIDKKYTTRKILEGLYNHTKNVYIYNNNCLVEMYANIYVFEFEKEAYIYLINSNVSESSLSEDINLYTLIEYDLQKADDKKSYAEYICNLTGEIKNSGYIKLTNEIIEELINNKEIFTTKQYMHSIPSISALLGKEKDKSSNGNDSSDVVIEQKASIPKVKLDLLNDVSFEIDLGDMVDSSVMEQEEKKQKETIKSAKAKEKQVDKQVITDEYGKEQFHYEEEKSTYVDDGSVIDMEALVFDSKTVKLNKRDVIANDEKVKEKKIIPTSKKIDLDKVSNLIIELPKKATKGKEASAIVIPNYIKDMIPAFFDSMENGINIEKDGSKYKEVKIDLEIIDINENKKYMDKEAKLSQKVGNTYISFSSEKLKDVEFEQDDIARIIKLSNNSYHIEIIPKETEEYSLWKKICTQSFRSSSRLFGMM